MKLKKVIALLLASVMSVTILAACGSNNTDTPSTPSAPVDTTAVGQVDESVVEEIQAGYTPWDFGPHNPVTITMWTVTDMEEPAPDNKIVALLRDRLGVTIDMEVTTGDNHETRIGTMLAGGQFPDIIGSPHNDALMTAGGALLRLDDYLATGNWPLLREHVEPYLRKLSYRGGEVPDGFYIFPNYNRWYGPQIQFINWGAPGFWIQKAVLEDAGFPNIDNISLDDYFALIENYAAKYPTIDGVPTVPFTFNWCQGREWSVTNNALQLQGGANWGGAFPDLQTNIARIYITDDYSYRWAKALNELNAKGLLDPEAFTMTNDQFQAKLATGAVLGFPAQRWMFGTGQDALQAEERWERTYVPLMPTFDGIPPHYATGEVMNIHQGYGISIDADNPEMILDFFEIMMSEEWQKILFWGIENEDYLVNEDGLFYRTEEMRIEQDDVIWRASNRFRAFTDQLFKREGLWPDGNGHAAGQQGIEFFAGLSEYDQMFLSAYGKTYWAQFLNDAFEMPPYYPIWQLHGMLSQDASLANTQLDEVQYPFYTRLVLANPADFDSIWQEFLDTVDLIDIDLYLSEINGFIQDILANQ